MVSAEEFVVMRYVFTFLVFCGASVVVHAESSCPATPEPPLARSISLIKQCCRGPVSGPIQASPIEVLNAASSTDAEQVRAIAGILNGQTLPYFEETELDFLASVGLAKKSVQKVLRSGASVYWTQAAYRSRERTLTYKAVIETSCGALKSFPRDLYPVSMNGRPTRCWPHEPGKPPPSTPVYAQCADAPLVYVEEPTWILFPESAKPLVIASAPGTGPAAFWKYAPIGQLPSQFYSVNQYFDSMSFDRDVQTLDMRSASTEFFVGIIPFVGSGVQVIDGAQNRSVSDVVLGSLGIVGSFAGTSANAIEDVCKSVKLASSLKKAACVSNLVSSSATVVLVSKNFLQGNGSGLQAGLGTLALVDILATVVLRKKHQTIAAAKLNQVPSAKPLPIENVRCADLPDSPTASQSKGLMECNIQQQAVCEAAPIPRSPSGSDRRGIRDYVLNYITPKCAQKPVLGGNCGNASILSRLYLEATGVDPKRILSIMLNSLPGPEEAYRPSIKNGHSFLIIEPPPGGDRYRLVDFTFGQFDTGPGSPVALLNQTSSGADLVKKLLEDGVAEIDDQVFAQLIKALNNGDLPSGYQVPPLSEIKDSSAYFRHPPRSFQCGTNPRGELLGEGPLGDLKTNPPLPPDAPIPLSE